MNEKTIRFVNISGRLYTLPDGSSTIMFLGERHALVPMPRESDGPILRTMWTSRMIALASERGDKRFRCLSS